MERLDNGRWGLESNCFVCEEKNRARIVADDGTELDCRAEVIDGDREACAEASATFVALGPAQAVEAAGARMPDSAKEFLRS